jgi:hypothetical protein
MLLPVCIEFLTILRRTVRYLVYPAYPVPDPLNLQFILKPMAKSAAIAGHLHIACVHKISTENLNVSRQRGR